MVNKYYNWQRFLHPREKSYEVDSNGFLLRFEDPELFHKIQPNLGTMSSQRGIKCLVVLGEPGIGKSNVMRDEYESIKNHEKTSHALYFNLNFFGTDQALINEVFRNAGLENWKRDNKKLYLFLDSLDEAILNTKVAAQIIAKHLEEIPLERLFIRISCRTGTWPEFLEEQLRKLFKEEVSIQELTLLSQQDINETCAENSINTDLFLKEIQNKNVSPFASRPNTLSFLVSTFKLNAELPRNQIDIYWEGCTLLAKELSPSRKAARQLGSLSPARRLQIASQIAAQMIFTNKSTISLTENGAASPGFIYIDDIISHAQCLNLNLTPNEVYETLDTGLFISRGNQLMGWAHQSYAEFLASKYLIQIKMPLEKIKSLLFTNDGDLKIIPVLNQPACWLAKLDVRFQKQVIENDVEILLSSDLNYTSDDDKKEIVESIISNINSGIDKVSRNFDLRSSYKSLAHKLIKEQISNHLQESTSPEVQIFLVDLAEACNLKDLGEDLLRIALNPEYQYRSRINAVHAITKIATIDVQKKLKPLLEDADDPRDEFRGSILEALWPDHLTTEDLTKYLTIPKQEFYGGSYALFLTSSISDQINESNVITLLKWAQVQARQEKSHRRLETAIDAILKKSWLYRSDEKVRIEISATIKSKMLSHEYPFESFKDDAFNLNFKNDPLTRQKIIQDIFGSITDQEVDSIYLQHFLQLFNDVDLKWLLSLIEESKSSKQKEVLSSILRLTFDVYNPTTINIVYEPYVRIPELFKQLNWQIGPIALGSKMSEDMKRQHEIEIKTGKQKKNKTDWKSKHTSLIRKALNSLKQHPQSSFYNLINVVTANIENGSICSEIMDITECELWKIVAMDGLDAFNEAGEKYLNEIELSKDEVLGGSTFNLATLAGIRFLRFKWKSNTSYLHDLPDNLWEKWLPVIIGYPTFNSGPDLALEGLINIGLTKQPAIFYKSILEVIEQNLLRHNHIEVLSKMGSVVTMTVVEDLFKISEIQNLKREVHIPILGELLKYKSHAAEEKLKSFLKDSSIQDDKTGLLELCYFYLLTRTRFCCWPIIFEHIQKNIESGRKIFLLLEGRASETKESSFLYRLSDFELGQLYLWLQEVYPPREKPMVGFVGSLERAEDLRDLARTILVSRGTTESCEAIRKAVEKFPKHAFLRHYLLEAIEKRRSNQWIPPSIIDFSILASQTNSRLVRNEEELQICVLEVLKNFQLALHDETPAVDDLWNTKPYLPKKEDEVSNRIKRHLDDSLKNKGIIINREVQIRLIPDALRTDIHIDAISSETFDNLTLIIEVKCCWNRDLYSSMTKQLAGKYLNKNSSKHGIYLISSFYCSAWHNDDYRKADSNRNNLNMRFEELYSEAKRLNDDGYNIKCFILKANIGD